MRQARSGLRPVASRRPRSATRSCGAPGDSEVLRNHAGRDASKVPAQPTRGRARASLLISSAEPWALVMPIWHHVVRI